MYTSGQIAEIIKGELKGNPGIEIKHIFIDSRTISSMHKSLFFSIKGQRRDGHQFVKDLYNRGVRAFVVEKKPEKTNDFPEACFITVENSIASLQRLAAYHREQFAIPIIGITGSNGKTTVKEWLFQLMREDKNIVRSPKSYNSQVGVPLSVWQLSKENELGIFEAGISMHNEMKKLEAVIQPTLGLITNLREAHDENFKNHKSKAIEKLNLFRKADTLIYCADYREIDDNTGTTSCKKFIRWSRINTGLDYFISIQKNEKDTYIRASEPTGMEKSITIPFTDLASIENAIHCWIIMLQLGYENSIIQRRMFNLVPVAMRLEMKEGINNCLIINDSYNSDMGSLSIALDFLNQQKQHIKKTLILSDILQSGKNEDLLYEEVAALLETKGLDRMIGIGKAIQRQAGKFRIEKLFFSTTAEFLQNSGNLRFRNEAILIKGARAFAFEQITRQLQQKTHETVMEINLNAVVHNLNYFRSRLNPSTKIMAMVKASSYGSGSYEIANVLQFQQIDYLAVAYTDEGVELRKAGITLPIMVMNPQEEGYDVMIDYDLEPEIFSLRIVQLFNEAVKSRSTNGSGRSTPVHIKLDTGMHRLGFEEHELDHLISFLIENRNIRVGSIFSHLSSADEPRQDDFTREQILRFERMQNKIGQALEYPVIRHILNSAGITRFPQAQYDMVRLGIGLYGIGCNGQEQKQLEFANTLKTSISQVKTIEAGESIGYNRAFIAKTAMRIATIPIGYADGLMRKLGNGKGRLMVNGEAAPIVGNVCMDMCMVDISNLDAKEGDEVIVFGKQYPITQFAKDCETIPYEVLTSMSARVKRVYYQE
jgi:alanine racemase